MQPKDIIVQKLKTIKKNLKMKNIALIALSLCFTLGVFAQRPTPVKSTEQSPFGFKKTEQVVDVMPETCGELSNATYYTAQNNGGYVTGTNIYGDAAIAQAIALSTDTEYTITGLMIAMSNGNTSATDNPTYYVRVYDNQLSNILAETSYTAEDINAEGLTEFHFSTPAQAGLFYAAVTFESCNNTLDATKPWIFVYTTEEGCGYGDYLASYSPAQDGSWGWYSVKSSWQFNDNLTAYIYPVLDIESSISEVELNKLSTVFPNPAKDMVTVASSIAIQQLDIYNTLGQCVYSTKANANQISVYTADFAKGNYIVKMQTKAGVATKKLVVE